MKKQAKQHESKCIRVCPCCEKAYPGRELEIQSKEESPHTRRQVITVIRGEFPGWVKEDGACEQCWKRFRDVVKIRQYINKIKNLGWNGK